MPTDATEVVPYLTSAATIVFIQKWLKQTNLYKKFVSTFPGADKWAHWFIAGLMSLVTAAGIHYVWNGTLINGGQLILTVPSLNNIIHGISDWFKVYILQHTVYEATDRKQLQETLAQVMRDLGQTVQTIQTPPKQG